jgi:uncharacterized protein (TIGR02646 family)
MIRLIRSPLDEQVSDRLNHRTALLSRRRATSLSARNSWKSAGYEKAAIRAALVRITTGIERCMYCGDSRGTAIDHFEPISIAPLRTFDWHNHLLACETCNSNEKRDSYPCDEDGGPLLIDPTSENPYDHLQLALSVGSYKALTRKGCETINVFQLNRADLRRGREAAFARCKSMLRDFHSLEISGQTDEAAKTRGALMEQPFADVLHAMYRVADAPGAATVLGGPQVVEIVKRWRDGS